MLYTLFNTNVIANCWEKLINGKNVLETLSERKTTNYSTTVEK